MSSEREYMYDTRERTGVMETNEYQCEFLNALGLSIETVNKNRSAGPLQLIPISRMTSEHLKAFIIVLHEPLVQRSTPKRSSRSVSLAPT